MSLLDTLKYKLSDALGRKTYAEEQKSLYKGIVDDLEYYMPSIESWEDQVDVIEAEYTNLELNPESAKGLLRTTYEEAESEARIYWSAINRMITGNIEDLPGKLAAVQEKYDYWSDMVEQENAELTTYSQQYCEELERKEREKKKQSTKTSSNGNTSKKSSKR